MPTVPRGRHILRRIRLPWLELIEIRYDPGTVSPPHEHAEARLMFVLSGALRETVCGSSHAGAGGCLAAKPVGLVHDNAFGDRGVHTLSVALDPQRAGSLPLDRYRWFQSGPVTHPFQEIAREVWSWDDASALAVEALVIELLARLDPRPHHRAPAWLETVTDYLRDRLAPAPSLDEVAEVAGVHPKHLPRVFRRHVGCPLGEYLRRARVAKAMDLMRAPNASLSAIAATCGFTDQAHFSRVFKARLGITPGAYRRVTRGEHA